MSVHRIPDRKVPTLFPWTTLEALTNERKRMEEARANGTPIKEMQPQAWAEYLARVLPPPEFDS